MSQHYVKTTADEHDGDVLGASAKDEAPENCTFPGLAAGKQKKNRGLEEERGGEDKLTRRPRTRSCRRTAPDIL